MPQSMLSVHTVEGEAREPMTDEEMQQSWALTFMVGGNRCCGVHGDELIVRLDPDREEEALTRPYARPMDFTGRPMRGFVTVRPAGATGDRLQRWVHEVVARAESLPPM